jgi:hypothetical protein
MSMDACQSVIVVLSPWGHAGQPSSIAAKTAISGRAAAWIPAVVECAACALLPSAGVAVAEARALREAGMRAVKNHDAVSNATRLERRQDVRDRIAFLVRQEEVVLAEKRKRIEEMLWAIHEANIGDLWETYEAAKVGKDGKAETDESGNMLTVKKERPRLISELSPAIAKLVEDVTADSKGRLIPRLYSKLQASKELWAMLNIGRPERESDISRLSDAELIQQLADLNYRFHKRDE